MRTTFWTFPLGSLVVFSLSCSSLRPSVRSDTAGWKEVHTEHFILRTDLPGEAAADAARSLEVTRAALLAAAWPTAQRPFGERVEAIVFRDEGELRTLLSDRVRGLFDRDHAPARVILSGAPATWEERGGRMHGEHTSVLKHELTHLLAASFYLRQPRWFSEGLAQFLETVEVAPDGKTAKLGVANPVALRRFQDAPSIRAEDLLTWSGHLDDVSERENQRLYGESWLLVHWLYNQRPQEFGAFQKMLSEGRDPQTSWKTAMYALNVAQLDGDLTRYSEGATYETLTLTLPAALPTLQSRPMDAAEVHLVRATVAQLGASMSRDGAVGRAEIARTELAAALATDPSNVEGLRLSSASVAAPEALSLARRAVEAHPESARAWSFLGDALAANHQPVAEQTSAYRKATELSDPDTRAYARLARIFLEAGKFGAALPPATRAVQLTPWDFWSLDTYAGALLGLHACEGALVAEHRAIDLLPHRVAPDVARAFTLNLAAIEAQCLVRRTPPTRQ